MKWLKNLEHFAANDTVGCCPYCGSPNTDYKFTIVEGHEPMGYGDFWCNDCRRAYHLSRVEVKDKYVGDKKIPSGLIY